MLPLPPGVSSRADKVDEGPNVRTEELTIQVSFGLHSKLGGALRGVT